MIFDFHFRRLLAVTLLVALSGCAASTQSIVRKRGDNPWIRGLYPESVRQWPMVTKVEVSVAINGHSRTTITTPFFDSGGTNPVLLFLHGTPGGHEVWFPVVATQGFTNSFRVVLLDLPEHGLATPVTGEATFESQAEFVAEFMGKCAISEATVIGHSYGGEVALRLAVGHHTTKVSKLVLMDAPLLPRSHSRLTGTERRVLSWRGWAATVLSLKPSRRDVAVGLKESWHPANHPALSTNGLESLYDGFVSRRGNLSVWRKLLQDDIARSESEVVSRLRAVQKPTLLLWGESDAVAPLAEHAFPSLRQLSACQLVIVRQSGHNPHEERPRAVAETIALWVNGRLPVPANRVYTEIP